MGSTSEELLDFAGGMCKDRARVRSDCRSKTGRAGLSLAALFILGLASQSALPCLHPLEIGAKADAPDVSTTDGSVRTAERDPHDSSSCATCALILSASVQACDAQCAVCPLLVALDPPSPDAGFRLSEGSEVGPSAPRAPPRRSS